MNFRKTEKIDKYNVIKTSSKNRYYVIIVIILIIK